MRIGVLDIGSNSIRSMTAARDGGNVLYSDKRVYTTRLAEGLFATGRLSDARMEQSVAVIERFCEEMQTAGAPVYAYATSAVRDATNRDAFLTRVRALGVQVAVLTGEEEARYAFSAATGGIGGMLDIGGGSTQLVTGRNAVSVPLGCVRAKDLCGGAVSLADIRAALLPVLDTSFSLGAFHDVSPWTGVGGTITTLGAYAQNCQTYDKRAAAGATLPRETLEDALIRLDGVPPERRADIPLLKRRYDVILHGGAILLYILETLGIESLRVSDADGLEGYASHILLS